ncbi:hypothetical protein BJ944DRAFT_260806 [Cunninghamella echinulata]|nr:hypothetical protein BJ944DRAFT_260806 [Cunninghamella echinulata]
MYYFDNNNKDDPSNTTNNSNNNNHHNNHNNPLFSQSFNPSSALEQHHSLDNGLSYLNFDHDHTIPPSSFLNDGIISFGHDSLLNQDWDGIYDSSSFNDNNHNNNNNNQSQPNQMFLPLSATIQHQQQQQQQQIHHSDKNNRQSNNPDAFLSLTDQEQQAILLSEPNFLRQQHLLQDTLKREEEEEEQQHNNNQMDSTPFLRSNLSAMFDQSNQQELQSSIPIPSSSSYTSTSSIPLTQQQQPQTTISFEEDKMQSSTSNSNINSNNNTTNSIKTGSISKTRKEAHRRSQPGSTARLTNRAHPIPISNSSSNSGPVTKHASSVPTEIDHQRRFNELQARFRVNYARKPTAGSSASSSTTTLQQQQQKNINISNTSNNNNSNNNQSLSSSTSGKIMSSSFSGAPSSFGGQASQGFDTLFGSVPTSIEKGHSGSTSNNDMDSRLSNSSGDLNPVMIPGNPTRNMRTFSNQNGWNNRQKSYAPFTSSALATPDRDDDEDPFDMMAQQQENVHNNHNHNIKLENNIGMNEEEFLQLQQQLHQQIQQFQQHQQHQHEMQDADMVKEESSMEWSTPSSAMDANLNSILQGLPEGVPVDQFMAWFSNLNNNDPNMILNMDHVKSDSSDISKFMQMDSNQHFYSNDIFNNQRMNENN